MLQTETTNEPVQVSNKYDGTQIKNAVDDEISRFFSKEQNFSQSHIHTDIKLLLGYVSCFIAGGSFLYEYKTSFYDALTVTTACVIVYWTIQSISLAYGYLVEKDELFAGTKKVDGKGTSTLKVSGKIDKHSPKYQLCFNYTDIRAGKTVSYKVEPNVTAWFDTKGVLVQQAMDSDLSTYLSTLVQKLHQE
ncbi:signal peptidase complex subunit 2 [Parasitella parasitica]|nr:signal peptidase complex subunit 2 [Parasitella parasitica]